MKRKIIILLSIYFLLSAQNIFSQVEDTLIYRYRRIAVDYQQQVKMAERGLKGAESKLKAAKSVYGPKLDFSGNYGYYGNALKLAPPADAPVGTPGEELHSLYSLDLTLYQPIITGGNLKNKKLAAQSEVDAMRGYLKLSKQEVMFNADKLYLNTVAKKEIYNLAIEYRNVVNDFVNVIKSKVEEEVVGKNELYQSKVRLNDAQYQVLKAAKDFEMSIMDLNKLLGFPVDTLPRVADSLMPLVKSFSADSLIVRALKNRPELTYLNGKAMATKYNEKVTVSKFKPQFGALAGGKWGAPSPGLKTDPDFNYYFKAQLKIPIYYWGQKQNEYNAVRQATQIAQLRVEQTKDAVVLQVQRSYYNLEKSQEQMKFAKSALNNAKKNVSVMLDRYNEGLSSVLEVLDAQAFLQKSFLNYIEAKYDVNVAYSEYMHALGEMAK